MGTRIFLLSILLFFFLQTRAQITTEPVFPVASQKVTIIFDSSKESRLGKFTGDLYAHTGVKIEGSNEWQHVIGAWGNNSVQPKLTHLGDGIYQLEITPNINTFYNVPATEKVKQLAFVFRSGDTSKQTNDLFVNVYEEGLIVSISSPAENTVLKKNEPISVSATASAEGTLSLYLNETLLAETTGKEITSSQSFTTSGYQWLKAKITSGTQTARDSVQVYLKEDVPVSTKPSAYKKGINYTGNSSAALVLWAPEKEFVYAIGDFNDWKLSESYQMKKDGDFFWLEIDGLTSGQAYLFQYFIEGKLKIADPYTDQIADPWNDQDIESSVYPSLPAYTSGKTEGIASVLQPGQEQYQWEVADFQAPAKNKMVIYELLIRDFDEPHSYQSVIDRLDYLEDLNINVLELMPVNEFEGNSSWGYNPSFYFAPDKYYGHKNDLKKLVDECHKRGIAVVIDMVLNHSYGQSPLVRMYWDEANNRPAANSPWYNPQSNFQNPDAQWGYDFNHESQFTRELVDSINSFWMSEYKVDGFRFDFTKGFSNTTYGPSDWGSAYDAARIANLKRMAGEIWKRNEDALVIFEHLADNSEEKELADYGIMLWGNINHNYGEAAMGYVQNTNSDLSWGVYRQRNWTDPNLVTYMESHDEERLTYKLLQYGNSSGSYNTKTLATATNRMELNNVFFIPLPGPKMIWQFGERGYDVSIDDFGGRLSEKPPRWEYLEDENRTDLFEVTAKLNYLKQTYEEFQTADFSYSLTGETKSYQLRSGENYVVAVGNFGVVQRSLTISFPKTGTWHDYFSKGTLNVSATQMNLTLAPGEYRLLSTRQFGHPQVVTENNDLPWDEKISVFPNPATNYVFIRSASKLLQANLYSVHGNLIKSTQLNATSSVLPLNDLTHGVYILKLKTQNSSKTVKIIKN